MRITNTMQTQSIVNSIFKNQSKMATLQTQLTSNSKINSASDNPSAVPTIMNTNSVLNKIEIYLDNITYLNGEVEVTEGILEQVTDRIQRLKDLTIEAANGTNSTEQLKMINDEVKQIKEQLVSLANTKYQNSYIFSGNKTGTPAYEIKDDGSIVYNGTIQSDEYKRNYAIADNVNVSLNFPGDRIFGFSNIKTSETPLEYDGTGLMQVVNTLTQLLDSSEPDYSAIRGCIEGLDMAQNTVLTARTENGANQTRLNMTKEQHENNKINYTSIRANVQEVDIAQIVSELSNQEISLQASMYVGSQLNSISLLDYL